MYRKRDRVYVRAMVLIALAVIGCLALSPLFNDNPVSECLRLYYGPGYPD